MDEAKKTEQFMMLLECAIMDAACERKMTQLKIKCHPEQLAVPQTIRVIVVPETMDFELGPETK